MASGGYTGRFLRVNLDAAADADTVTVEETPDPSIWLGARGWNALIGWNEVGPGVGPYDPENRIVFSAGPLVGTGAPTAGRTTVSTIGPRGYPHPMWTWSSIGGYFGAELKHAGYDGIVVQGQASSPCYILIEDEKVTVEDASELWGQGTFGTQHEIKARHSMEHQIVAIGPAGENRVRFASIMHRLANAVGNAGFGGVMGSKNLKAIAVRGTRGVPIADPMGYLETVDEVWHTVKGGIGRVGQASQGYPVVACTHGCSVNCGTRIATPPSEYMDTRVRMLKCNNGALFRGSHPAYEGVHATSGQTLSIPRPEGLGEIGLDLGNMIEDLGLTTWFFDSWSRYLSGLQGMGINDVLGLPIRLHDPEWWRDLILMVAHREGVGDEIAEDLARFYDKHEIGPRYLADFVQDKGSRGHGWHREGRAMEKHPSPFWEYSALLYAVSTRDVTPSTHGYFFLNGEYGYPDRPKDPSEVPAAFRELARQVYGSEEAALPGDAHVEYVTAWHQHRSVIKDSLGLCDWVFPVTRRGYDSKEEMAASQAKGEPLIGDLAAEAKLFAACTGIEMDIDTMEHPVAERIVNLERCLDIRNYGRTRRDDEAVIPHYQWTEKTDHTGISANAGEFRALLDRYYDVRGWDRETGAPTAETLSRLGLGAVCEDIEA